MNKLTLQQLQSMLAEIKGARIVTLVTTTVPDMRVKNNPYHGNLVKISKINGIVNWNYSNAINRQRLREEKTPDFVPQPRKWGTRLIGLPFVSHVKKDGSHELYLEFKVERPLGHVYRTIEPDVLVDSKLVESFLNKKSSASEQGLEKEVILRDYNVKTITQITIDGETYALRID